MNSDACCDSIPPLEWEPNSRACVREGGSNLLSHWYLLACLLPIGWGWGALSVSPERRQGRRWNGWRLLWQPVEINFIACTPKSSDSSKKAIAVEMCVALSCWWFPHWRYATCVTYVPNVVPSFVYNVDLCRPKGESLSVAQLVSESINFVTHSVKIIWDKNW